MDEVENHVEENVVEKVVENVEEVGEKVGDTLEIRKEKVILWLKNPYNATLVGVLVLALIIRIYYFGITSGQAVWWDEAEYMNMGRAWAGALNYDYTFFPVRPVMLSLIISVLWRIGSGELLTRLFLFGLSMVSVYATYLVGKEMYNRKMGLIIAFFMSIFYLHIFQTYRVMVDIASLTFFLFSVYFFYRYINTNNNKMLYLCALMVGIGTLFRITTSVFLFVLFIYLLITEKLNFLKKKEYWIALLIFFLVLAPYFLWGYYEFGGFVITQAGAWNKQEVGFISNGIGNIQSYFGIFKGDLTLPIYIFFYLGILSMYKLVLGFDLLIKGKDPKLKKDLFLLLWFLLPMLFASFSMAGGFYDARYMINSFPAMFLIAGGFIFGVYDFIKSKHKVFAIILIVVLLSYIGYLQYQRTDATIRNSVGSYELIKESGIWMKENSEPTDIIMTASAPQIEFYSERRVIWPTAKREKFDEDVKIPGIRYFMLSVFEQDSEWAYAYPDKHGFSVAHSFMSANDQPLMIIYNFESEVESEFGQEELRASVNQDLEDLESSESLEDSEVDETNETQVSNT